jgi:hypothetical protein
MRWVLVRESGDNHSQHAIGVSKGMISGCDWRQEAMAVGGMVSIGKRLLS